jgi:hypothetical protein
MSEMWGHLWQVCEPHSRKTCFVCHPEDAWQFSDDALRHYISLLSEADPIDLQEIEAMRAVLNCRTGSGRCMIVNCPCGGGKAH